jgi:hypothetical protein
MYNISLIEIVTMNPPTYLMNISQQEIYNKKMESEEQDGCYWHQWIQFKDTAKNNAVQRTFPMKIIWCHMTRMKSLRNQALNIQC